MSSFLIVRAENMVAVDNAPMTVDCSSLDTNIATIAFDARTGGKLQYNDRPKVRETFFDPTPYMPLLNAWMAAQLASTPPLTLPQSKAVKNEIIDSIYQSKRVLPISVAVGAGTFNWEATDDAVANMVSMMAVSADNVFAQVGADINTMLAAFVADINVQLSDEAANVNALFSSTVAAINAQIVTPLATGSVSPGGGYNAGADALAIGAGPSTGNYALLPTVLTDPTDEATQSIGAESITVRTLGMVTGWPLLPIGATVSVSVNASEIRAIVAAILGRRAALNVVRAGKKAFVSSRAAIADVIAYNVTTGWP